MNTTDDNNKKKGNEDIRFTFAPVSNFSRTGTAFADSEEEVKIAGAINSSEPVSTNKISPKRQEPQPEQVANAGEKTNVSSDENEKPAVSLDENGEPIVPLDENGITIKEDHSSARLIKLRDYYAQLGKVRDDMQKELENILAGTAVEGEIEEKLYEFSHSWRAMADEINRLDDLSGRRSKLDGSDYHVGENLMGQDFSGQNLVKKDFSAANLQDANLSGANLSGADLSGADLSGADLSNADLTDAILAGAKLKGTNFTGAKMQGVILRDADIEDAILMDVDLDDLAIEELQALVEYLAVYYPHKLNLRRINLSLLNLAKIDLRYVNLNGVDFTGCDFTGVNVMELDLSACIITPEQIAQAIGHKPSPEELRKILAPKNRKKAKKFYIDFSTFLQDGHFLGWTDLTKHSISTDQLVKAFMKVKGVLLHRPEEKDEIIFEKARAFHAERLGEGRQSTSEEQRKNIEERKQKLLEGQEKASKEEKYVPMHVNIGRNNRDF